MHIFTNAKPIDTGSTFGVLEPGSWLVTDQNAAEFALMAERGSWNVREYEGSAGIGRMTILRSGAIGDLLLMTPAIAAFKAEEGWVPDLCCAKKHQLLFAGSGLFEQIVDYPPNVINPETPRHFISLENVMELAPTEHATDAFAKALGVTVTDYKPVYRVRDDEKAAAIAKYPRPAHHRRRLGIQMIASTANRSWRPERWASLIQKMINRNWEVFAFGSEKQMKQFAAGPCFTPVIAPFRESAAILSTCDAFCGIDSAMIHLAHALDIPAVGLYAAFDWRTRTGKAPLTHAITGVAECAPCSWHQHAGRHFPPDKPCAKKGYCIPLDEISVDRVTAKIDGLKSA